MTEAPGFRATTKSELPTGKRIPARMARFSIQFIHHRRESTTGGIILRSDSGDACALGGESAFRSRIAQ